MPTQFTSTFIFICIFICIVSLTHPSLSEPCFPSSFTATHSPSLQSALFTLKSFGWTGGDGSTTTRLYENTYAWVFSDSLIGPFNTTNYQRSWDDEWVHSCIALMNVTDSGTPSVNLTSPRFYWNTTDHPPHSPTSFFVPSNEFKMKHKFDFWWPAVSIAKDHRLVSVADEIRSSNRGLGFESPGTSVIVVEDTRISPQKWKYQYVHYPHSSRLYSWTSALTLDPFDNETVYWVGKNELDSVGINLLARINWTDLVAFNFDQVEFFGFDFNLTQEKERGLEKTEKEWEREREGPSWYSWTDISVFESFMYGEDKDHFNSEFSLKWHESRECWYGYSIGFGETEVYLFSTPKGVKDVTNGGRPYDSMFVYNLTLPWSDQNRYYEYSVKSHDELSTDLTNQLVFSFDSNFWNYSEFFDPGEGDIYVPTMVTIDFD